MRVYLSLSPSLPLYLLLFSFFISLSLTAMKPNCLKAMGVIHDSWRLVNPKTHTLVFLGEYTHMKLNGLLGKGTL